MTVGENIKKARKKAGLTQGELGKRMGITAAAVSAFEKDKTNIKYSTIEKFANALGISVFNLSDDIDVLFHNHLSETSTLFETAERFFRLLLATKGNDVECVHGIDYKPDYNGEPVEVETLQVIVDGNLYYSIEPHEVIEIMQEVLDFFKYKTDKYKQQD